MNWKDDNNPWGSNNGNNPWGGESSNQDFEKSIKKVKDRFGKLKMGSPKNIFTLIVLAIIIWIATGLYRVEPDEQGVELLFGKWSCPDNNSTLVITAPSAS